MTARRHRRITATLGATLTALSILALAALPAGAATTEQIVVDPNTGLAINGYDPVAYFTEGEPTPGRRDLEATVAGAVWRFSNAGNRAAFIDSPETYLPQFGGYDPVGLARGVPLAGDPRLSAVQGQRVYLFFNAQNRDAFVRDSEPIRHQAEEAWPAVRHTLAP